ncbi:signal peptidase I, partial [Patescibacteria group bacterium]
SKPLGAPTTQGTGTSYPTPPQPPENTTITALKGVGRIVLEFTITLVIIFVISLIIRMYVLQPFVVDGQSMEPNFHNSDYLLAEKVSNYFSDYQRGEVVIFHSPTEGVNLIKRIIALPGERIVIEKNKVIIYPGGTLGTEISENYITSHENDKYDRIDVTLKNDELFVMGDNRSNSRDSREFGPITEDLIIGKVWLTIIPITDIHMFSEPKYPKEISFIYIPSFS